MFQHNCFNCKFYMNFTSPEKEYTLSLLSKYGVVQKPRGGCTYRNRVNPMIIRRYIHRPVSECFYWIEGRFSEELNIKCLKCQSGVLALRRIPRENQTKIIISCSNYPICKFITSDIRTNFLCRYCDTRLTIHVDQHIIYSCGKCNRQDQLLISIYSKPSITKATCPHDRVPDTCKICSESISSGKSLVEIETPIIATNWRYIRNEPDTAWDFQKDKWIERGQPRLQEEFLDEFDNEGEYTKGKPVEGVLGSIFRIYLERKGNQDDVVYFKFAGLRPRNIESDSADYDYSEEELKAALFADEVDRSALENNISPGQYIEQMYGHGKSIEPGKPPQEFQQYSRGKVILKYFELALSGPTRESSPDPDDDDYGAYHDEKNTSSHSSNDGDEYYSDVDEAHEEYVRERTEAMDEHVHSHDTGWYEG